MAANTIVILPVIFTFDHDQAKVDVRNYRHLKQIELYKLVTNSPFFC